MRLISQRLRLPLTLAGGVVLLLVLKVYVPGVRALAYDLYLFASSINATLAEPINNMRLGLGVPVIGAFLLGLLAATAPCQLSTNTAAIAYFSTDAVRGRGWDRVLLFLGGKTLVYLALAGIAVWVFGGEFGPPAALFVGVRRALGPVMIVLGLVMLGWLKPRLALPLGVSIRLETWAEAREGRVGALVLGAAFGLAFCPTLFLLFFGLMLPTAVASSTGVLFPLLFALGTGVPLLLVFALIGSVGPDRKVMGSMRRANRILSVVAGNILVLTGFYDTVLYWFI